MSAILILGAGRMAGALARALSARHRVVLWGRHGQRARSLADTIPGTGAQADLAGALDAASAHGLEAVLLAVTDEALPEVAAELAELGELDAEGPPVLHLSGYHGTAPLAALAEAGVPVGCLHPNAAVTPDASAGVFGGVHFGLTGEGRALAVAEQLCTELGGVPLVIPEQARPLYHAAATMLSNGLVGLFAMAEHVLYEALGHDQLAEGRELLRRLLASTAANLSTGEPEQVLTGPVARGDLDVVEGHARAMRDLENEHRLYGALTRACMQVVRRGQNLARLATAAEDVAAGLSRPLGRLASGSANLVVTLGPEDVSWRGDVARVDPAALVWRERTSGIVELRLDLLLPEVEGDRDAQTRALLGEVRALLGDCHVLVACHPPSAAGAGGRFAGSERERLELLAGAAAAGADAIDLDQDLAALLIELHADGEGPDLVDAQLLLSHHLDLPPVEPMSDDTWAELRRGGPPDELPTATANESTHLRLERARRRALELIEAFDRIEPLAGRVGAVKLVGAVERIEEALDLAGWARLLLGPFRFGGPPEGPSWAVFAGGPVGAFTRLLSLAFGADFTFAAARAGGAVPGQPDALSLVRAMPGETASGRGAAILGILGHPVSGSLSPQLFTRLHERTERVPHVPDETLYLRFDSADPAPVLTFAARHGIGLSVTAPHKAAARRFARNANDKHLRELGVANTLVPATWCVDGEPRPEPGEPVPLIAFNTDLTGVRAALDELFAERGLAARGGFSGHARAASDRPVVVLGAGGAARAALAALRSFAGGADLRLVVLARDPKRAMSLAREYGAAFGGLGELARLEPFCLIHTTTAGSAASPDPTATWVPGPEVLDDLARRVPDCRVLDANYRPDPTPLVAAARERGLKALDGRTWFLSQALAQFELFHGEPFAERAALDGDGATGLRDRTAAGVDRERAAADLAAGILERVVREAEDPAGFARAWRRRHVVLVGQRGSGKSTTADYLAAHLGTWADDLDARLGLRHGPPDEAAWPRGMQAGELLAELGEARFRLREATCLEGLLLPWPDPVDVLNPAPPVLALGGGAVESPQVRELLADCTVVWLRARPETLAARVAADPTPRPPIAAGRGATDPLAEARAVAAARDALYAEVADHAVDTDDATPDAVAAAIARLLEG